MNKLLRNVLVVLAVFLIGGAAVYLSAYWSASRSDEYKLAVRALETSEQLQDHVGIIMAVKLDYLGPSSIESIEVDGKWSGKAEFMIDVQGKKRDEKIHIRLIRNQEGWVPEVATLQDGTALDLSPHN